MYYRFAELRFECTRCGACCIGKPDHYVALAAGEAQAIRRHLGLSRNWFRRRYITQYANGAHGIRLNRDGRCPFLTRQGGCRIYAVRPVQCSSYPFWSELVSHRSAWLAEKRRCEGIQRGKAVPRAHIEALLKLQEETAD
jgi:Fe-S-cluster containining protein